MSKVKITGHASGSGTLTLTGPNTNSDRTVTMPDATGTMMMSESFLSGTPAVNQFAAFTDADTIAGRAINGTVSQSSGVTTGAIAEEGSNSNGKYTKYAGGLMICTQQATSASGSDVTWTFPAAFVSGNVPAFAGTNSGISPDADGDRILCNAAASRTYSALQFRAYILSSNSRSTSAFMLSAIGRWY